MKIVLPEKVNKIITALEARGYEAYAVGGCVRDSLLGRTPQDWDITTSAKPEQVKQLFSHTIDTGIAHGTVTVMLGREGFEVTTYRIDGEYEDARHPKEVQFTENLREDLRRRDFTINAMAYNETAGLVDAFDGMGDLKCGVIRCVGKAAERFSEDALRMLRAVRTSAKPEQVKQLFSHTIDTGIAHGTVTVMLGREGFEVTTYRIDGEYEDARHPKEVQFTADLREDLRRRDFTINAMAYNETAGLVDAFDGMADLNSGVIRCVGKAAERFSEDALRMLRAVRFAAQLGFFIEEETKDAIRQLAPSLAKVSAERIQAELVKLLVSAHPKELRTAYETGLTAVFLPELDRMMVCEQHHPHHCYSVGDHTIEALGNVQPTGCFALPCCFMMWQSRFAGQPMRMALIISTDIRRRAHSWEEGSYADLSLIMIRQMRCAG